MHFGPDSVTALAQLNRNALPDVCTVEVSTRTATPGGGHTEAWAAVSVELTDLPCRVSSLEKATERATGGATRSDATYAVAFDGLDEHVRGIKVNHRLQVRSGQFPPLGVAFAATLYVLSIDAPQSLDPFPKATCTTLPQPGQ